MDLSQIGSQLADNHYGRHILAGALADLELIAANCEHFNAPGSQIFRRAGALRKAVQLRMRLIHPDTFRTPMLDEVRAALQRMVSKLVALPFAEPFAAPVPAAVPGYYKIIKRPMDLGTLSSQLVGGMHTVADFFDAFLCIFSNCRRFNRPDSPLARQGDALEARLLRDYERWAAGR